MSELILPSDLQIPVSADWSNADLDDILTLQYDDGTTVTNVLTGATGETFDAANIVGVTASTGERVGATWSSAKPADINSNPFSLLATLEDVQDEYCLSMSVASETITFPLTGAWSGTITYDDLSTSAESGSGDFVIDGQTPKRIKQFIVTDTVNSYFWTFNEVTIPVNFIDHYHGELAAHLNMTDVNMQRVIPEVNYTIGESKDYTSPITAVAATKLNSDYHRFTCYGQVTFSGDIDIRDTSNHYPDGALFVAAEALFFKANFTDTNVAALISTSNFLTDIRHQNIKFKGLILEAVNVIAQGAFTSHHYFERCGLKAARPLSFGQSTANIKKVTLKECVVWGTIAESGTSDSAIYLRSSTLHADIIDAIVIGNSGGVYGVIRNRDGSTINLVNALVLSKGGTTTLFGTDENFIGSNVITSDDKAANLNIGVQESNLDTLLADASNGNMQITEVGRTTIGNDTGWNGSTICEFADALISVILETVTSNLELRQQIMSAVVNNVECIHQIYSQITKSEDFRNQIYSSTTQELDTRYSISSSTETQMNLQHQVFGFMIQEIDLRSQIHSAVVKELDTQYALSGQTTKTIELQLQTHSSVTKEVELQTQILSSVIVHSTVDIRFAIMGSTDSSIELRHQIYTAVVKDLDLRHQIYTIVNSGLDVSYRIFSAIERNLDVRLEINSFIDQALELRHQIFAFTQAQIDARYDIKSAVTSTVDIRYNVDGKEVIPPILGDFSYEVLAKDFTFELSTTEFTFVATETEFTF